MSDDDELCACGERPRRAKRRRCWRCELAQREQLEQHLQRARDRYRERRQRSICRSCPRRARPGLSTCAECGKADAQRKRAKRRVRPAVPQ